MEILEAFDLTGSFRAAGELAGCSHHTVEHYVALRDEGRLAVGEAQQRPRLIDPHLPKVEEWVERSNGKIRADVVADKLRRSGSTGRSARCAGRWRGEGELSGRAAAGVSAVDPGAGDVGAVGLGTGPRIGGRATNLFCAWLAWCRFRVVIADVGPTLPTCDRLSRSGDARLRRRRRRTG